MASVVFTQLDLVFNFENFRDKISIFFWKKRQVFEDLWIENRITVICQLLQNWGFNFSQLINWKMLKFWKISKIWEWKRADHVLAPFLSNKYFGTYCQITSILVTWCAKKEIMVSLDVISDRFYLIHFYLNLNYES